MSVQTVFKLAFQVTPIWLTGDPVASAPGQMIPFAALTDPDLYRMAAGNLGGAPIDENTHSPAWNLDDAFGAFTVLPGGTLIRQEAATNPFANQHVASNATIFDPLNVSLVWDTPMRGLNAWNRKYAVMQNVQARLYAHNNGGGTFTVVTPAYIYTNMILEDLSDASRGGQPIPQNAWRFNFTKPLITLADLSAAQSALMAKLTAGLPTDGAWTGPSAGINLGAQLAQMMDVSMVPAPMPSAIGTLTGSGGTNI